MPCTEDCTKKGPGWYCASNGRCQKNNGKFKDNNSQNVKRIIGQARRTGMKGLTKGLGMFRSVMNNPDKNKKKKLERTAPFRDKKGILLSRQSMYKLKF